MLPNNVQSVINEALAAKATADSDKAAASVATAQRVAAEQDEIAKLTASEGSVAALALKRDIAVNALKEFLTPSSSLMALRSALKAK